MSAELRARVLANVEASREVRALRERAQFSNSPLGEWLKDHLRKARAKAWEQATEEMLYEPGGREAWERAVADRKRQQAAEALAEAQRVVWAWDEAWDRMVRAVLTTPEEVEALRCRLIELSDR